MTLKLKSNAPTTVTIAEIGEVLLKKLSATKLAALYDWYNSIPEAERTSGVNWLLYQARMVQGCVVNEDGSPFFDEGQLQDIADQEWLTAVYIECSKVSELHKDTEGSEVAKKD